jgi:hypothetical protein
MPYFMYAVAYERLNAGKAARLPGQYVVRYIQVSYLT